MGDLEVLTKRVRRRAAGGKPLELLMAAVVVVDEVMATADEVLCRAVKDARDAGHSWSQIGEMLGVSRQAAQQRFGGAVPEEIEMPMSPRLRRVLRLARKEARLFGAEQVAATHLLLGVLKEGQGYAARLLADRGVDFAWMTEQIDELSAAGARTDSKGDGLSRDAAEALRLALTEAGELGDSSVGTEHLLLGLLRLGRGGAYRVLTDHDLDANKVREHLLDQREGPSLTIEGGRLRGVPLAR